MVWDAINRVPDCHFRGEDQSLARSQERVYPFAPRLSSSSTKCPRKDGEKQSIDESCSDMIQPDYHCYEDSDRSHTIRASAIISLYICVLCRHNGKEHCHAAARSDVSTATGDTDLPRWRRPASG